MQDFQRQREQNRDVAASRAAMEWVRPYARYFPDWHSRAVFISAGMLASATTSDDRERLRSQLAELIAEVEAEHAGFLADQSAHLDHSRVRDIEGAFSRLLAILRGNAG